MIKLRGITSWLTPWQVFAAKTLPEVRTSEMAKARLRSMIRSARHHYAVM